MSSQNSKEGVRPGAIMLPFFHGVIGFIVLFAAGSRSGSSNYAVVATCVWFLSGTSWFLKRFPSGWPVIGIVMNLPLWLFFIWTEAGQF
jgi:hypothetical protein